MKYWLSHPGWQDNSRLGQSAGLFWEHLAPFMSTHSWESSWERVLDLSVENNKMICYVSVWWLVSTFPWLWEVRNPLEQRRYLMEWEQPVWLCWWWWGKSNTRAASMASLLCSVLPSAPHVCLQIVLVHGKWYPDYSIWELILEWVMLIGSTRLIRNFEQDMYLFDGCMKHMGN